ncbi:uncharacterized protein LOC119422445 [Nematolebias whitei]|uniref:uncharacterized protein LOC119422445 n=1 Tax=Nematolebias whitei TaxID=451745 RepID=UPI0018972ECF|nr:uncharacterized protein LOC119422445 [Nematolebias whitei]
MHLVHTLYLLTTKRTGTHICKYQLEVLHLLSSSQKAELLLSPEMENQDNGTLTVVFNSLLTGEPAPSPSGNFTVLPSPYNPYSPQSGLSEIFSGFKTAFTAIGSFAHEFVSFTSQRNLSEIKSATLTQFLLNFTLAELADLYELKSTSEVSPQFDVTSVEAWYQQVVLPVLRNFWPNEEDLTHQNITLAFHELFFLDNGVNNESSEIQDVCSLTLDKASCGLTDAVEDVAHVLHCAARSNLTLTESTVLKLINELTSRLNSLMKELSTANFEELISDFRDIFKEGESPSLTQQHLEDPEYIKLWFRIKLLPLLPDVDPNLLSCLSTKNFSCPAYQTLVAALDERMSFTEADPTYGHNIYKYFIYSFLVQRNNSDSQCVSSADRSAEWLTDNFGSFSKFASITDFYELNPYFSGLEALPVLSSKQLAELLLLPLRTPPEKDVVIDRVLDFLLESPQMGRFPEVLLFVVELASEVSPPCNVYRQIFDRLFRAIPSASVDMEPVIWARIDDLINIAPEECVPANITCPETQINGTNVCSGIDSSDLQSYLNTSTHVSCNFTLEKYACPQLESFTANQLASLIRCDLPGNSSYSKVLWKMLLTHLSSVLDPALDILANVSVDLMGPSAQEVLDVISELRVSLLTDEQLEDSGTIQLWFSDRLSGFLPFASGRFLRCLTNRNISCQSYQQILQVYNSQFKLMSLEQQHVVLKNFVLRFLSAPHSGPGCASFNSSSEWLRSSFGLFSDLLSVRELLDLNPQFNPVRLNFCYNEDISEKFSSPSHLFPQLSALTAQDLAELLKCNRSSSSSGSTAAWKLLLSKASLVLDEALELLANSVLDPSSPSVSMILDSIREIRLDGVSMGSLNNPSFIQLWLNHRLHPFLPAVSSNFLSCLASKALDCNTYQLILQILSEVRPQMVPATQMSVYTHFIRVYLTRNDTADPACRSNINSSVEWLQRNLGGFSVLLSIQDVQRLYPDFSALDALSQLTATQLADVAATPGLLTSPDQVAMVMGLVPDQLLASFFDDFSAALTGHENMLPSTVRSAFLEVVFARANLSYSWVDDSAVSLWLRYRLPPLLINLSPGHVTQYFQILAGRNCSIEQQGVENLNSTLSTLSENSQQEIYNHIIQALKGKDTVLNTGF